MNNEFEIQDCGHFSDKVGNTCRECISENNDKFLENVKFKRLKDERYSSESKMNIQFSEFEKSVKRRNLSAKSRIRGHGLVDENNIGDFTSEDIKNLLEKQDNCCLACFTPFTECVYEVDHKIPVEYGGNNSVNNLQLLCKSCNIKKGQESNEHWISNVRYTQVIEYLEELREEESYGT